MSAQREEVLAPRHAAVPQPSLHNTCAIHAPMHVWSWKWVRLAGKAKWSITWGHGERLQHHCVACSSAPNITCERGVWITMVGMHQYASTGKYGCTGCMCMHNSVACTCNGRRNVYMRQTHRAVCMCLHISCTVVNMKTYDDVSS